jgi:hypothetical protein
MPLPRKDSIDSIPDVDFIAQITEDIRLEELSASLPSEFKIKEMSGALKPEPLLVEDKTRFVLFPIKNNDVCNLTYMHTYINVTLIAYLLI